MLLHYIKIIPKFPKNTYGCNNLTFVSLNIN